MSVDPEPRTDMSKRMVYFALEPRAATEAIQLAKDTGCAVWVGADAISEEQHRQLTRDGINVTRFSHSFAGAAEDRISAALSTIEEHHPDAIIRVQHRACSPT